MKPEYLSALRWLIALGSGWIIGKGWLTADQAAQAGGILTGLAVLAWSVWNARHQQHAKVDAAAEGILLGQQIADPKSDASLADASPAVQAKVNELGAAQ